MSGQMALQVGIPKTKFSVTDYVHIVEKQDMHFYKLQHCTVTVYLNSPSIIVPNGGGSP